MPSKAVRGTDFSRLFAVKGSRVSGNIVSCNFGCFIFQVILPLEPVHPFGVAVVGDFIYWTDWVKRSVIRANKYTGEDVVVLQSKLRQQPMGLVIVAEDVSDCE